jgi:hypothetical protein
LVAAGAIALLSGACTTTIVPPTKVQQPQPVFVLDHGHHTSLVLPHPDGLVRYAYGDWSWYVEMQTGATKAIRVALWPTPAALGRRVLPGTPTESDVRQAITVGIETLHEIVVDARRLETLRAELDGLFDANASGMKNNPWYGLAFVPHPSPYTLANNSNRQVAGWLRELGCAIEGPALWARWRIEQAAAKPGATAAR